MVYDTSKVATSRLKITALESLKTFLFLLSTLDTSLSSPKSDKARQQFKSILFKETNACHGPQFSMIDVRNIGRHFSEVQS